MKRVPIQRKERVFHAKHQAAVPRRSRRQPAAARRRSSAARERAHKGEISAAELKAVEDREIERIIKKQEEVGLQAITDGEFRRSWWHLDFLWGLDGVEKHVMDTGIAFAAVSHAQRGHQGHRQARLLAATR